MKPRLQAEYIDTGQVFFIWRHYPFIGTNSLAAAVASSCAHRQGAFWEYHDLIFARQAVSVSAALRPESLLEYVRELGLDEDAFRGCYQDDDQLTIVQRDFDHGRDLNIFTTPTFFINGRLFVGAQTYQTWVEVLDALLADVEEE